MLSALYIEKLALNFLGTHPAKQVQEILYRSTDTKILERKVEIVPYQWYDLNVKAMRTRKPMTAELFSSIVVKCGSTFTKDLGKCVARRPSERCTFHDCSIANNEGNQLVYCPEGPMNVELELRNEKEGDTCKWGNIMTSSVAKISLYPVQGKLFC